MIRPIALLRCSIGVWAPSDLTPGPVSWNLAGMLKATISLVAVTWLACSQPVVAATFDIPLFIPAAHDKQQGFIRIINHSEDAGVVSVRAIDDSGRVFPPEDMSPVEIPLNARQTLHFNSDDLEMGNPMNNPDKVPGLETGVGEGMGNWRLVLESELDIEPLVYVRTEDGFLTSMHDLVPVAAMKHEVAIFNPGRNPNQISRLRLINPGDSAAQVEITGVNDKGGEPENAPVTISIPAAEAREITAKELEDGRSDFTGSFGFLEAEFGRWRLFVTADAEIQVMSLLESPTGHLTNLSTRTYDSLAPSEQAAFDRFVSASRE